MADLTKAKKLPRFDVPALRRRAGPKTFDRGESYYRGGYVAILNVSPGRVTARVEGSDVYEVEITGRGAETGGRCSCPAFEETGFCKHMVATALAANELGPEAEAEGAAVLARIRAHLKKKGIGALVDLIVDLAEQDPKLFRELDLAAATKLADDGTLERRLRLAIDQATTTQIYIDDRQARGWAAEMRAVLDTVAELIPKKRAGLALALAERAIDGIGQMMESIDDSDGHCGALLEQARDIHLEAAGLVKPEPVAFARDLFWRETEDDYDTFFNAAAVYEEVLGEAGLAEYRRLAAEAWKKGSTRDVERILDCFAERDGDVDARIALRARTLTSQWEYLRLAEFCLEQGRKDEALRRAEEGLRVFEDKAPDERLVLFAGELMARAGRKSDAEAILWRVFEKAPSLELYKLLVKLGGTAARDRVLAFLDTRAAGTRANQWGYPANLLIRILMIEKMWDAAWKAVHRHGASSDLKEDLARRTENTHSADVIPIYTERVSKLVNAGGNPSYQEAAKLVKRMKSLRGADEQAAYIAGLRKRFERRRNFIKLLPLT